MAGTLEVRLQNLEGTWETIGVDRYPGVQADAFQAGSNEWGYDTCSFVLRRPTDMQHPDLSSFTPCEVYRGGSFIWEGRVRETPTTGGPDGQINVTGVGWQAHLDDDMYEATYVQTDLTAWQDVRSLLTADLAKFRTNGQVQVDSGAIVLSFPPGTDWTAGNDAVGVLLDLGPNPRRWCRRICALAETSIGLANLLVYVRAHDAEGDAYPAGSSAETIINGLATSSILGYSSTVTSGTWLSSTATNPHRYWTIFLQPGASIGAPTATQDYAIRIKQALVFRDAAYESGNASTLTAPTLIRDALDTACPQLSADRSQIDPAGLATFVFPEFALDGPKTARDVISAANAVHRWRTRIKRDRVPEFAPQPNAPLYKVGAWGGSRFQDASSGSGEEIYNRVLVTGQGPSGEDVAVERRASIWSQEAALQPLNPSASIDLSHWTPGGGFTFARDTGVYNTSPASFRITNPGGGITAVVVAKGDLGSGFAGGRTYKVDIAMRSAGGTVQAIPALAFFRDTTLLGSIDNLLPVSQYPTLGGSFTTYSGSGPAPVGTTRVEVWIGVTMPTGASIYWDDVVVSRNDSTLVDRRGFTRTKQLAIQSALTPTLANQLGDIFLATHARTPLKGSIDIQPGGLRSVATDEEIHPSELLNNSTELIRLAHLIDPDTGAVGRDGIIAAVSYNEENETASVQLDNDRNSLESLLTRMAIVTGGSA